MDRPEELTWIHCPACGVTHRGRRIDRRQEYEWVCAEFKKTPQETEKLFTAKMLYEHIQHLHGNGLSCWCGERLSAVDTLQHLLDNDNGNVCYVLYGLGKLLQ